MWKRDRSDHQNMKSRADATPFSLPEEAHAPEVAQSSSLASQQLHITEAAELKGAPGFGFGD